MHLLAPGHLSQSSEDVVAEIGPCNAHTLEGAVIIQGLHILDAHGATPSLVLAYLTAVTSSEMPVAAAACGILQAKHSGGTVLNQANLSQFS